MITFYKVELFSFFYGQYFYWLFSFQVGGVCLFFWGQLGVIIFGFSLEREGWDIVGKRGLDIRLFWDSFFWVQMRLGLGFLGIVEGYFCDDFQG